MSKLELPWIDGRRLMERWGIRPSDLHQAIFYLHLPVFNSNYGRVRVAIRLEGFSKSLSKELEDSQRELEELIRSPIKQYFRSIARDFFPKPTETPEREPTDTTEPDVPIHKTNLYDFQELCKDPLYPDREGTTKEKILDSLIFRIEDVKEFEGKHGIDRKITAEDFVRNLRVSYESDSEITIKIPLKKVKVFTYDDLGFKDNEVWKAFIYTIKEPPHIYELGPAHIKKSGEKERISQYDTKMGRLRSINKKLIDFFNQECAAQLPEDFKLYELCKEEGAGKYKYTFQVSRDDGIEEDYHSTYEQLPEDKLIDEVKALFKKYSATNDQVVERRFVVALNVAREKGLLSDDEVSKMFNLDSNRWSSWEKKEYPQDDLRDDDLHEV
jgi:hypothetical protein